MKDLDMMNILMDYHTHMTQKQLQFVANIAGLLEKGKPLSIAQHQYLQAIYDQVVAYVFGLEPIAADKEYAAQRAIFKARKSRVK